MIKASRTAYWRWAAKALPGIQSNVMVVSASREKSGGIADTLSDRKYEYVTVEGERAVEIGDLKVDMANTGLRMNSVHK